jgi:hypothetical protein
VLLGEAIQMLGGARCSGCWALLGARYRVKQSRCWALLGARDAGRFSVLGMLGEAIQMLGGARCSGCWAVLGCFSVLGAAGCSGCWALLGARDAGRCCWVKQSRCWALLGASRCWALAYTRSRRRPRTGTRPSTARGQEQKNGSFKMFQRLIITRLAVS